MILRLHMMACSTDQRLRGQDTNPRRFHRCELESLIGFGRNRYLPVYPKYTSAVVRRHSPETSLYFTLGQNRPSWLLVSNAWQNTGPVHCVLTNKVAISSPGYEIDRQVTELLRDLLQVLRSPVVFYPGCLSFVLPETQAKLAWIRERVANIVI